MTDLKAIRSSPKVIAGHQVDKDLELSAEICIIGSGAGGATSAKILAEAGHDVLLLEEGGYYSEADFTMREADVIPKLYQEGMQRTSADGGIAILQGRAVGGTTVVNWTTSFRTPEAVLAHWQDHHAVGGFTMADLAPHYEAVEARLGIYKVEPSTMNTNNRLLYDGCEKLGWQPDTLKRNVHGCMNSGYCGMGCPFNAKRSMLVTCIPDAIDAQARLLFRCRVDRLIERGGEIALAEATLLDQVGLRPSGFKARIKAQRFIVAGGAINSPGLLLRSAINDNGLVGSRTFLHPTISAFGLYDEPVNAYAGAPQSAACHHFIDRGSQLGVFFETAPLHPVLTATALPGFGAVHSELMANFDHVAAFISLSIDGFHQASPGGQVKLRSSGAAVLDYPLTEPMWESIRFAHARLFEAHFAAGAKRVGVLHDPPAFFSTPGEAQQLEDLHWRTSSVAVFTAHQMGGLRMGDDAKSSVVRSSDLRHHRLRNLYVMDGSVFPTSLGVNPQESIYGLTRLMATRLA